MQPFIHVNAYMRFIHNHVLYCEVLLSRGKPAALHENLFMVIFKHTHTHIHTHTHTHTHTDRDTCCKPHIHVYIYWKMH